MPRPRKDQEGPSAVERMEEAFWDALAEKPYAKISVSEIAQRAKINKNAFYYHYGNLDELVEVALRNALPVNLLQAILAGFIGENAGLVMLVSIPEHLKSFDRICLIAGRHGTPALQEALKDAMRHAWRGVLGIDEERFGPNSMLMTEFMFSGVLALLVYRAEHMPDMSIQELFGASFVHRLQRTLPALVLATFQEEGAFPKGSPFLNSEERALSASSAR